MQDSRDVVEERRSPWLFRPLEKEGSQRVSGRRHERRLTKYTAMQNTLAGINPNCAVLNPIRQIRPLFSPATTRPIHILRATSGVDNTVRAQEK